MGNFQWIFATCYYVVKNNMNALMKRDSNIVPQLFLVHCVDTEGPLEENLQATFDRLRENKSLDLPPSLEILKKLQQKQIDLKGREEEIADYIDAKRISYLSSWGLVGAMLRRVTSPEFRMQHADPFGNPYTFSWFIIDIVGYLNNPRKKSIGFHSVFDHFHTIVEHFFQDVVGWHFHTVPANGNAVEYNTCWTNNDWHEQSICRRLIERKHFPSIFRAGGHIERNDLNFWLEQYIPFDFSCRSYDPASRIQYKAGDINDWRGAPTDWSPYHPCFYDYRKPGNMRRSIFRTLDIDSNACQLTEREVEKAFLRARTHPTILSVSTHDRRDMAPEILHVMELMQKVSKKFSDVSWMHSNALSAARAIHHFSDDSTPQFSVRLENGVLYVSTQTKIFGPQPFLAIQEGEDLFYRDNFTIESDQAWAYKIPAGRKITRLGIAASAPNGAVGTKVIRLSKVVQHA